MRVYIYFIVFYFFFLTNLFSQDYVRNIDFLGEKKVIHNGSYVDVQDFSNSVYEENNPCMYYFERIETSLVNFDVEILDAEYSVISKSNLPCNIPEKLSFNYKLNQYQKKNFIALEIFPYIKKEGEVYFLTSFRIKILPTMKLMPRAI